MTRRKNTGVRESTTSGPDGKIGYEDLGEGTLLALRSQAVAHGQASVIDEIKAELEKREAPDLYRHSRRRKR